MKKKITKMTAVIMSFILILSACGTTGTENPHTTTIAPTTAEITTEVTESTGATEEITTEGTAESTEQTEAISDDFTYEAVYSGSWSVEGGDKDGFLLVTGRDEIDDFVKLDSQSNEKYSSEWFETHALICVEFGHSSCDVARLRQIEVDEETMIIYIDVVHDEEFYKENKDFEIKVPRPMSGSHTAAEGYTKFFIELDKGGKEFVKSMKEVMARWRDWPYSAWREATINLGKEEEPVLELEDVPFIAGYRWTEKGKYRYANEYLYGYEKWGDKMVVSARMHQLQKCFDATDSEELHEKRGFLSRTWNSVAIYTMFSLKTSYDCEVKKVSIEDETLRVYADVVHEQWEQLTEAEQDAIKSGKVGFLDETDENKYEMYLAINTEYREEYVELMKTLKKGVLVLRDVMSGKTTEVELEFFSLAGEDLGY